MDLKKTTDPTADDRKPDVEALTLLIKKQVLLGLGSPRDLLAVKVHPLGNDRYRVNVHTGAAAAMARITDSFFVTADDSGNVTTSSPKIVRTY